MIEPLAGRRVIVTGAAAGIGAATLAAVAGAGAHVVAVDIDESTLGITAKDAGDRALPFVADVTTPEGAERAVGQALESLGGIDGLVNVVGGSRPGKTVGELGLEEWRQMIGFNLDATFLMCHYAIAALEDGGGAIVNISSGAGVDGMPRNPAYCAAKAGVIGLTKALAIDHGPNGVRVNAVAPGAILTPLMQRNRTPAEIAAFGQSSALRRVGRAEEIAGVVTFLLSDAASYVNGQTISINGG
jgi:NAD(P)-dependent dehydrogenase (short-subunit alcohol dehydrogenase family)